MDDLISRQAAYDTLTEYYHHRTDAQHEALQDALNRVPSAQPEKTLLTVKCELDDEELRRAIEDVKNAELELIAEQREQRWIPVSEKLPNSNGCYLVWRPHFFGGEKGMPAICYFDGQNVWHDSYGVDFERVLHPDDVTAWMPLPEPYKGEES